MIESYMVFGGIPYYLHLLDQRLSLAQSINELCFKEYGDLCYEYDNLFRSLFHHPEKHIAILEMLATKKSGMTRADLSKVKAIGGGSVLTKDLKELEECGFIRKFVDFCKEENDALYQLIDPFTLFSIAFIQNGMFVFQKETKTKKAIHPTLVSANGWKQNKYTGLFLNKISGEDLFV